jgi:hypothetical protein
VIILGDFNLLPTAAEFDALRQRNYSCSINEPTNISLKMPKGSTCVDNMWLSTAAKSLATGRWIDHSTNDAKRFSF